MQHEKDFIQAQQAGASGYGSFTIPGLEILWVCPFGGPSLYGRGCDRSRACPQTGRRSNACRDCGKAGDGGFSYNLPVKVIPDAIIILIARAPIRWVHTLDARICTGREHG